MNTSPADQLTAKLRIEHVPIRDLLEPSKNPNQMAAEDFSLLVEGIRRVGFLQPILVRPDAESGKLRVIDGVHRLRAAQLAEMALVPVVIGTFEEDEAAALQIGMNRLRGELDLAKVAESMSDLADLGWTREDLTLTGFSPEEVDALVRSVEVEDDEDVLVGASSPTPEPQADKTYVLEVVLPDAAALRSAKRRLKTLGGGDIGAGLLALLEEE
jgi:ParB/RepB/Spo0J family partition protein